MLVWKNVTPNVDIRSLKLDRTFTSFQRHKDSVFIWIACVSFMYRNFKKSVKYSLLMLSVHT
jgi:hypothetical protein